MFENIPFVKDNFAKTIKMTRHHIIFTDFSVPTIQHLHAHGGKPWWWDIWIRAAFFDPDNEMQKSIHQTQLVGAQCYSDQSIVDLLLLFSWFSPSFSKRRICHFVCLYNTCKSNHCACAWWCTSIDASFFYRRIHPIESKNHDRSPFLFLYVIHATIEEMARLLIRWKYEMNDHAIKLILWQHIKRSWKRRGWVFHMRTRLDSFFSFVTKTIDISFVRPLGIPS